MTDFNDLFLKHKGKRILVMGGGPSLEVDLDELDFDIAISTNGHGVEFVKPDYVLAMDETNKRTSSPMGAYLRSVTDAPIISPHGYADFQLVTWPQSPRFVLSGMVATWAAFVMGAKVVLLAGCDGYGGDKGFVFEAEKMARDVKCPVRVVGGGPLTKVWDEYKPAEKFGRYQAHSSINGWLDVDERITVRARKPSHVLGRELAIGEEAKVMRHQVARLLKHRMVEEV
ncbi:hypothetical protein QTI05_22735 [Variovorax sp. J22R193]|uniref:hypothetical protein n=1 Tax=Variovorax fucosicus TaxID=3053517 RepID=UPI002575FD96|nr:hypothetical protein [Variovorax sp. J22R193]MDM0041875.1 hypothetical protein [Variovorax sp. J22R193]